MDVSKTPIVYCAHESISKGCPSDIYPSTTKKGFYLVIDRAMDTVAQRHNSIFLNTISALFLETVTGFAFGVTSENKAGNGVMIA